MRAGGGQLVAPYGGRPSALRYRGGVSTIAAPMEQRAPEAEWAVVQNGNFETTQQAVRCTHAHADRTHADLEAGGRAGCEGVTHIQLWLNKHSLHH